MATEIEAFAVRVGPRATILAGVLGAASLVFRSVSVTLGLLVASALDIGTFYLAVVVARRVRSHLAVYPALAIAGLFEARIILKIVLLFAALELPWLLNFWSTLVGVLVVEGMIMIEGIGRGLDLMAHREVKRGV